MHILLKSCCIGMLSLSVTGCIPLALAGAGAATGASLSRDSRSLQTISDDTDVQYQVNQALKKDKKLYNQSNISNLTFNHIVLLVGQTPTEADRIKAEQLAQKVPKVRRVYNQIQVAPNIGAIQVADDATISTNIKARMAVTSNLNSNNFDYTVENKVVYLMGLADRQQARYATDVIRNSSGVKKLVTLVELTDDNNDGTAKPAPTTSLNATSPDQAATSVPLAPAASGSDEGNSDVSFQPIKE